MATTKTKATKTKATKTKAIKTDEETTCGKCKSPIRHCECSTDAHEDVCYRCGGDVKDCMCTTEEHYVSYCRWCDQDQCGCDIDYDEYAEYMAQKDYCYNCGKHHIECKCEDTRQEEKEDKK